MDWRLIAAVSAAAGSFCFVAVGAVVVLTHAPAPQPASAPAPVLLSEYRFPVATPPSLLSAPPVSPTLFAPGPYAPQGNSVPAGLAATSGAAVGPSASTAVNAPRPEDFNKSPRGHSEPKQ